MQKVKLTVRHKVGLHARPAAKFVALSKRYRSTIQMRNCTRNTDLINAKSLIAVLKSAISSGSEIELHIDGEDEEEALQELRDFIMNAGGE